MEELAHRQVRREVPGDSNGLKAEALVPVPPGAVAALGSTPVRMSIFPMMPSHP